MHLQRVQVPDFRVLKDVDITFEHNFNPRVFPLGSQNGGGKSTLLQLIFVLLHCSTNPERIIALKNLLGEFHLYEGEDQRVFAIIDIWDGSKLVKLEFFVCNDYYVNLIVDKSNDEFNSFNSHDFVSLNKIQEIISNFQNEEYQLKQIIEQFDMYSRSNNSSSKRIPEHLRVSLLNLGIEFESIGVELLDQSSINKIEKDAKSQLLNKQKSILVQEKLLSDNIDIVLSLLKEISVKYIANITTCNPEKPLQKNVLLCRLTSKDEEVSTSFLNDLSDKIFLTAPSTQVFLFLSQQTRKSLFTNKSIYQSELVNINSVLSGLFTYDFLATDILIKSFKSVRDKDFKEALKTGKYGNNYEKLLQDLDFLMHNKQVNLKDDFTGLTFTLDRFNDSIELYPEDLSHGELKRLSIYMWLKYQNIEDSIVLMDEVDLALHPDWQYQIVSDLLDWEPSNQYILATHSYELCNALTPSHVKILEPKLTERRSD
jgi:energy-coupling factor transporter ATP-binding protein EcfA2